MKNLRNTRIWAPVPKAARVASQGFYDTINEPRPDKEETGRKQQTDRSWKAAPTKILESPFI
jgi:hypothetical protein